MPSSLTSFLNGLLNQPVWIRLALCTVFYLSTVLPHVWFGTTLNNWVFSYWTRSEYDSAVLILSTAALALFIWILISSQSYTNIFLLFHLLSSIVLSILVWKLCFVINIEAIHFIQYAILACLLFPLTRDLWSAHLWCLLLGIFDEAYQFFVLAPHATFYFDMNDVVTNTIGAAFGTLVWMTRGVASRYSTFGRRVPTLFLVAVAVLLLILRFGIDPTHPYSVLRQPLLDGFHPIEGGQGVFHIIGIPDGLFYIMILMLGYRWIYQKHREHFCAPDGLQDA